MTGSGICSGIAVTSLFVFAVCGAAHAADMSGHVTDALTGAPIPNATVEVGNGTTPSYQGVTDAFGFYQIRDVASATDYTLVASAPGYASEYILMQSPGIHDFALSAPADGYLAPTSYRGVAPYGFDGDYCYRADGTISQSTSLFPGIEDSSPQIDVLLASIGAGTDPATTPEAIWQKCVTLWNWLQANALYAPGDAQWEQAMDYMTGCSGGWPSVHCMALTYQNYGFIPWGTCMSRAQITVTLMYRIGLSMDEVGIAESNWKFRYSQHMYAAVWIADRWLFLDPSYNHLSIPPFASFRSVPPSGGVADYCHPTKLSIIPGSGLSLVPELTRRSANAVQIVVAAPPAGAVTLEPAIEVFGFTWPEVSEVTVAGQACAVVDGGFNTTVDLGCGDNTIIAQVVIDEQTFTDTIVVHRTCLGDFDDDGDVDLQDFAGFGGCMTGPDDMAPTSCLSRDMDRDGDVDLADAARFQDQFQE